MHNSKRSGSFFPCLFINMLMNIEGLLPAVILLVLHFWLKISVWWSVGAFIAWILYLIMWMVFIGWAGKCGSARDLPKENKNPYSVGNTENKRWSAGLGRGIYRSFFIWKGTIIMGLIKAGIGALGGTLADQWKEFFYSNELNSILPKQENWKTNRRCRKKEENYA